MEYPAGAGWHGLGALTLDDMSTRKSIIGNILTAVLTLCAVTVTGLVARRELFSPAGRPTEAGEPRAVPDWRTYTDGGQRIGPAAAPVTIVEFSDFQCPYCREAAEQIREVRRKYPDQVAVLYRHVPITAIHPHALPAAKASLCAGEQARFEAYHDALFANQRDLGKIAWTKLAQVAAVPDTTLFARCMQRAAPFDALARDLEASKRLGVTATPTLLVNDQMIVGAPGKKLEQLVRRAMSDKT